MFSNSRPGTRIVAIPDREVFDAMRLEHQLRDDPRVTLRLGDSFSAAVDEVCDIAAEAEVIAVGLAPVNALVLDRCPNLRLILKCGIGMELIDVAAALERSITVARTAGANFVGVAEYVIAAALNHIRQLPVLSDAVHQGEWDSARARWAGRLPTLRGAVIGLVGLGAIGRHVAHLANAFGAKVIAYDPYVAPAAMADLNVAPVELDDLLRRADIVSVHATLTRETTNLLSAPRLALMKPTALLVNAARGGLVDQEALASMLERGQISGAVLDVLASEPPAPDEAIVMAPHCLITPHLAGCTQEGYWEIGAVAADLIRSYLDGIALPASKLVTSP